MPRASLQTTLLGSDPDLQVRMSQGLLALALVFGCALFGLWASFDAGSSPTLRWLWFGVVLGGETLLVLAIRTGFSLNFADPSLTMAQIVFTMVMTGAAYPLLDSMRTAVLPVFILILSFSTCQLRQRQTQLLSAAALILLASAITVDQHFHHASHALKVDLGHFVTVVFCVYGVAILSSRMARLRRWLTQQREDLSAALVRIEELAIRDTLTGLYNRRHGEELLRQAQERIDRGDPPKAALLLDLDHFKRVNDQHGHAAGDDVLRTFAELCRLSLRATDAVIRWGGEEFLVLLSGEDAQTPIQRLRDAVAATRVPVDGGDGELRFSFSGGLAWMEPGDSVDRLLERADLALYSAKGMGRDRVEWAKAAAPATRVAVR